MAAAATARQCPSDIKFDCVVVDVCCHPGKDVVAAADIDGEVTIHSYSTTEQNHLLMTLSHHKKSCRAVCFSPTGTKLFTTSKDKSIQVVDMDKGAVSQAMKQAHSSPIYSLLVADDNIIATGDDDGYLKVWDMRQQKAVMELKECEEFVSDMGLDENKRYLLATSGDGTLTAFDIRKHKMKMQSELFDSELLSLAIIKKGEKVVCGSGEGIVNIFNWGEWGNISDRFPGHPMSIDCMTPLTEDIVLTGSFDGIVRAVSILPNRIVGVVGRHDEFPVENMSLSHCKHYLASCSHDQRVKFWNVDEVGDLVIDGHKRLKHTNRPQLLNPALAKDDFFADMAAETATENVGSDDDDDDEDGDEDSDSDSDAGQSDKAKASKASRKQGDQEAASDEEEDDDDDDGKLSNSDESDSRESGKEKEVG